MRKQVNKYFCDFCDKSQDETGVMVIGHAAAAICAECARMAMEIVINHEIKSPRNPENSTIR